MDGWLLAGMLRYSGTDYMLMWIPLGLILHIIYCYTMRQLGAFDRFHLQQNDPLKEARAIVRVAVVQSRRAGPTMPRCSASMEGGFRRAG